MDTAQIEQNKERFKALCHQYITREGLDTLLEYLETKDFYTAPSSTKFHLNEDGGLCLHSMNVFETALKIYHNIDKPAIEDGTANFPNEVSEESIAIATLFHDLCKMDFYKKTEKWKKDEQGRWQSYTGYGIDDTFPLGHGEKSLLLLHTHLKLTAQEMLAVRWHMGMFDMGESGSAQSFAFREALNRYPLVAIVHAADFLASNLLEKTTTVD